MAVRLDVNADSWIKYTNNLEKLSKTAFPNAVRGTLNGLAFDMKKNTVPEVTEKVFTIRQKNFFKANSRVETARGNSVNSMKSTFGFISRGGNQAIEDLEKQERGGVIPGRSYIATDQARTGKSPKRLVARKHRISGIKRIVHVENTPGKTENQKFIKSVVAAGKGGHVLHKNMLFFVQRLKRTGNNWKFKLIPIQSFQKGRKARVTATRFMEKAIAKTVKKADAIYYKEAERQFLKHMR